MLSYVPGQSIINNLIRFGGFTLIGFFVNQVSPLMPKLIEFSNSIKPGMEAFATFTDSLVVNTIDFIDRGYKAYDTVRGLAKSIGGENFVGVFDNFSSALNIVVQGTILAGLAGTFKPRRGGRGGDVRGRSVTAVSPRGSATPGYAGNALRYRKPGQAAAGGFFLEQSRKAAIRAGGSFHWPST